MVTCPIWLDRAAKALIFTLGCWAVAYTVTM